MSSADAHLYGIRKPKNKTHEISSSSSLSFASTLSSLLSTNTSTSSSKITTGRPRPAKKADIFTSHNKGTNKRALKDISDDGSSTAQIHSKTSEEVDSSVLHRSKRKMEEKARIYAAMKRGDYVPRNGEKDETGNLIDFDRKWAETKSRGEKNYETETDDDGDSDSDSDLKKKPGKEKEEEMIEYEDEFGRVRSITKSEAAKRERIRLRAEAASIELEELRARPTQYSSNLIYGNTIQHAAFNPDTETARKMEELAKKRDKEETPPPETHYEADKEIRSKGVGFYSFSKDEETRKREMEALEGERRETERRREEREGKRRERLREVEERRRAVKEKRARKEADAFLDALVAETGMGGEKS